VSAASAPASPASAQRSVRAAYTAATESARNTPSLYTAVRKPAIGNQATSATVNAAARSPWSSATRRCRSARATTVATAETAIPPATVEPVSASSAG
jgi:hypothetical protein